MMHPLKRWTLLLVILVSLASIAYATPPMPASGTITLVSFNPTVVKNADGNTFSEIKAVNSFAGNFTGTTNDTGTAVLHPDGVTTFKFISTFTGTVDGKSGTLTIHVTGKNEGGIPAGTVQGEFIILSGTGELANLHGQGSFNGSAGVATYSAKIHFDPE